MVLDLQQKSCGKGASYFFTVNNTTMQNNYIKNIIRLPEIQVYGALCDVRPTFHAP